MVLNYKGGQTSTDFLGAVWILSSLRYLCPTRYGPDMTCSSWAAWGGLSLDNLQRQVNLNPGVILNAEPH